MERANAFIGSPMQWIEDLRFLKGKGTYVADLARDGALHAAILRSAVAYARIKRIDIGSAAALVITAKDIGDRVPLIPIRQQALPESEPYRQPVIAVDKVRYVGEPVAMVLAADAGTAEDARELIALDLEELSAIASNAAARSSDVRLFEASQGNRPIVFFARKGDSGRAFAEAFYTCRKRFSVQRHMALPMETRGILAEWNADRRRLVVHGAAKVPLFNRRALAGMLGLCETEVDLIEVDVGGGFGARGEFYPEDFLIPFATKRLQCPVRWIEDRREHLMAANHARQADAGVEIACDKDGRVLDLRGTIDTEWNLPRPRAVRGRLLHRASYRHCGQGPCDRPRGVPQAQPDPRSQDALQARAYGAHRPRRRDLVRRRGLCRSARSLPCRVRLEEKARAARPMLRWPLSRYRARLLH